MIAVIASSGAAGGVKGSTTPDLVAIGDVVAYAVPAKKKPKVSKCPYARLGLAFYRGRYLHWQIERGASVATGRKPRNCADARYLVGVWVKRARASRLATLRWHELQARRLRWDPMLAINTVFGSYAPQAHRVASCESGHSPNAVNGQYLGMFQMGSYARSRYGHGPDPLTQARAAYQYFVDSGRDWSPWSCKP